MEQNSETIRKEIDAFYASLPRKAKLEGYEGDWAPMTSLGAYLNTKQIKIAGKLMPFVQELNAYDIVGVPSAKGGPNIKVCYFKPKASVAARPMAQPAAASPAPAPQPIAAQTATSQPFTPSDEDPHDAWEKQVKKIEKEIEDCEKQSSMCRAEMRRLASIDDPSFEEYSDKAINEMNLLRRKAKTLQCDLDALKASEPAPKQEATASQSAVDNAEISALKEEIAEREARNAAIKDEISFLSKYDEPAIKAKVQALFDEQNDHAQKIYDLQQKLATLLDKVAEEPEKDDTLDLALIDAANNAHVAVVEEQDVVVEEPDAVAEEQAPAADAQADDSEEPDFSLGFQPLVLIDEDDAAPAFEAEPAESAQAFDAEPAESAQTANAAPAQAPLAQEEFDAFIGSLAAMSTEEVKRAVIAKIDDLLQNPTLPVSASKKLMSQFVFAHKAEMALAKEKHVAAGGDPEAFVFPNDDRFPAFKEKLEQYKQACINNNPDANSDPAAMHDALLQFYLESRERRELVPIKGQKGFWSTLVKAGSHLSKNNIVYAGKLKDAIAAYEDIEVISASLDDKAEEYFFRFKSTPAITPETVFKNTLAAYYKSARNSSQLRSFDGHPGLWASVKLAGSLLSKKQVVFEGKLSAAIEGTGAFDVISVTDDAPNATAEYYYKPKGLEEENNFYINADMLEQLRTIFEGLITKAEFGYVPISNFYNAAINAGVINVEVSQKEFYSACMQTKVFGRGKEWWHITWYFNPRAEMREFIFFGFKEGRSLYKDHLRKLKNLALPENWGFNTSQNKDKDKDKDKDNDDISILDSYLVNTLYRLRIENKILERVVEDGEDKGVKYATFNTGLVTKLYLPICCLLKQSLEGTRQPWQFIGFGAYGQGWVGKQLVEKIGKEPEAAHYFEGQDLLYDTSKEMYPQYKHIIIDNIDRIPEQVVKNAFLAYNSRMPERHPGEMPEAYWNRVRSIVQKNQNLQNFIKGNIDRAIKLALKRVEWNYKTAIPMYYPRGNKVGLFLPLSICDNGIIDTALVVMKAGSKHYSGATIYPLDWAYTCSRQVCRPDSDWLSVDRIHTTSTSDDIID